MSPSIVVFADNVLGAKCLTWLLSSFRDDVSLVVCVARNQIYDLAHSLNIPAHIYTSESDLLSFLELNDFSFDLGLLLWWPSIIHDPLISFPRRGFVNTHPSFLPYNRGKHPNFWSIVTKTPCGVTLHFVDQGVDTGKIIAQQIVPLSWTDTGETLYFKSLIAMFDLFVDTYPLLRTDISISFDQPQGVGSFHKAVEITKASELDLDSSTTVRDLLNRLRARTFSGYPACTFTDDGIDYEVTIRIKRK